MTEAAAMPLKAKEFLGHPVGLIYLVFAEAFERFSYYGMRSLLTLYLVQDLLQPGHVEHVIGFGPLQTWLTRLYGPLQPVGLASIIVGFYAFTYLTPLLGGLIADRWLGRKTTITIGAVVMAFGHFLMAFEQSFLIALVCILIGVGCFKGNISSQVGNLYGPGDARRGQAFQIFYLVFAGAVIIAPIICGTLGQKIAWHWGFGAAGVSMLLGLLVYLSGSKYLPAEAPRGKAARDATARLTGKDWEKIGLLILLMPLLAAALVMNEQIFINYITWGNDNFDLHLLGFDVPSSWLVSLDAAMSVVILSASVAFWTWWSTRRTEPDEMTKIAFSGFFCAAAPLALVAAAMSVTATTKASLWWAILFEVLNGIGFANVIPVGMALFARVAPQSVNGTMIGIFMLTFFGADFLAGTIIGPFMETMGAVNFWGLHAVVVGVAAVGLFVYWRVFGKRLISVTAA